MIRKLRQRTRGRAIACLPPNGLRGVYHRARIRATRWLYPSCGPIQGIAMVSPMVIPIDCSWALLNE